MEPIMYDVREEYMAKIEPLVKQLLAACAAAGVQLVGLTTYGCHEKECSCGRPDCAGGGIGHACETFGVGETGKMSNMQLAMMMLGKLPQDVQAQFCDAIVMALFAVKHGGNVQIITQTIDKREADGQWN